MPETTAPAPQRPTQDHIHTWFSLSYSNYLVFNRTLLQSMPDEWQATLVELLHEMDRAFDHVKQAEGFNVQAGRWVYVNECTDLELKLAGVTSSDDDPDSQVEIEPGVRDYPDGYETTYYLNGDELQDHDYVFVPGQDPVPHYRRGRTYIAPRVAERTSDG